MANLDLKLTQLPTATSTNVADLLYGVQNGVSIAFPRSIIAPVLSVNGQVGQVTLPLGISTVNNDANVTGVVSGGGTTLTLGWQSTLAAGRLNSNVVQAITNDTNITGSINSQNLSLGWTGTLAAGRLNSNVVQSVVNDTNVTGAISAQALTLGWTGVLGLSRGGTSTTTATGTAGSVVLSISPTLTGTPVLSTAMATTLVVGDGTNVDHSGASQVLISRNFTPGSSNTHSFSDSSIINWNTNGFGSCAYDDETIIQGSGNPNHHASFQTFPTYAGTGTMSSFSGWNCLPTVSSGIVNLLTGINFQGVTISGGGSVGNVYGFIINGIRTGGPITGDRGIISLAGITNEFRGVTILSGGIETSTSSLTLVNGLNSNTALPTSSRVRITGPTGAFSVGGFVAPPLEGHRLYLYNSTSQAMTIINEDASSTAANRIHTLTGANVTLRTGTSFATLSYDGTDNRWILESTN